MSDKKLFKKILLFTLLIGAIFLYYYFAWGSLDNFNQKVDPCDTWFCDFSIHYYPTAQSIFKIKEPIAGYLYSPFFAILTSPLGQMPLERAIPVWGAIQVILTLLLFMAPISELKLDTTTYQLLYLGIFFTSLPVLHNFKWGQVSSLMTYTIILAFLAYKSGKSVLAGVLLGIGTSIKYYPGVFILYFLLKKDKRVITAFVLTCVLLLFIFPALILGLNNWINFINLSIHKLSILGNTIENPNTQYFPYMLMRFLHIDPARLLVVKIFCYAGIAVALFNMGVLFFTHNLNIDTDGILSISLIFCTLPFVIETSWHHYFVFLPFIQMALLQMERKGWLRRGLVTLSIILSSIFLVNFFPSWWDYTKWGFSLLSTVTILIAVYWSIFETYREQRRSTE